MCFCQEKKFLCFCAYVPLSIKNLICFCLKKKPYALRSKEKNLCASVYKKPYVLLSIKNQSIVQEKEVVATGVDAECA